MSFVLESYCCLLKMPRERINSRIQLRCKSTRDRILYVVSPRKPLWTHIFRSEGSSPWLFEFGSKDVSVTGVPLHTVNCSFVCFDRNVEELAW